MSLSRGYRKAGPNALECASYDQADEGGRECANEGEESEEGRAKQQYSSVAKDVAATTAEEKEAAKLEMTLQCTSLSKLKNATYCQSVGGNDPLQLRLLCMQLLLDGGQRNCDCAQI